VKTTTNTLTTSGTGEAILVVFFALDYDRCGTSKWPITGLASRLTLSAKVAIISREIFSLDGTLALAT
jgi:hypothetical protein